MPPIQLNRRRFLGCSAAAGIALGGVKPAEGATPGRPIRIGLIGLGHRGTTLLRACLEDPTVEVKAQADTEPRHLARASGIVEKARGARPDATESAGRLLDRPEVEAVLVALPCDLHARTSERALDAGKHTYAEKPLGLTIAECDRLISASAARPDQVVHVGYQRRSHPRYREAVAAIGRGEIGPLLSGTASWVSSNGPVNGQGGWLSRRDRSGDWMVEQAVHVWDVFQWATGATPTHAFGSGRRDVFRSAQPDRDVTDDYQVMLRWADGFSLSFVQSWAAPADDAFTGNTQRLIGRDGGFDFSTGVMTHRDRSRPRRSIHPGVHPDTSLAVAAFLGSCRLAPGDRPTPPVSLAEAREATVTGLMARLAVDENRAVTRAEVLAAHLG